MLLAAHLAGRASKIDPFRGQALFEIELGYDNFQPRRPSFLDRLLLAVQESPSLFAAHPQLVDLIGCEPGSAARARTAEVPISPLRLHLSVYSGR